MPRILGCLPSLTRLFLLAAFLCACHALRAQFIDTNLTLTGPTVGIGGQPVTLIATLTVSSGPVSATNGLQVVFSTPGGNVTATLANGVATAGINIGCGDVHGCNNTVFASFAIQGNFLPSQAQSNILAVQPASLDGHFAFIFHGRSSPDAPTDDTAAIGTLNIVNAALVSGVADFNTPTGAHLQVPLSGSYTQNNAAGTLQLTMQSTIGSLVLTGFLPYTSVSSYGYPAGAATLAIVSAPGSALLGSGTLAAQVSLGSSGFAGLQSVFLFNAGGHTACAECGSYGHDSGFVHAAGQLFLNVESNAGSSSIVTAEAIGSNAYGTTTLAATVTAPDANGRLTFTLTPTQKLFSDQPTHYAAYAVDATHLYLMSLDPHSTAILLSGAAFAQQ